MRIVLVLLVLSGLCGADRYLNDGRYAGVAWRETKYQAEKFSLAVERLFERAKF